MTMLTDELQEIEFRTLPATIVALDTETHRFGAQNLAPKLVCLTAWDGGVQSNEPLDYILRQKDPLCIDFTRSIFEDEDMGKVFHNAAYDLAVLAANDPQLISAIFENLEKGLVFDTMIREKLLNLTTYGEIDFSQAPKGLSRKLSYQLSSLVMQYKGVDRSVEKGIGPDGKPLNANETWRLNFAELENLPVLEWPEEAVKYAVQDSIDTYDVFWDQEDRRKAIIAERGYDPFAVQGFRVAVDFCLRLMSIWGVRIDHAAKAEVEKMLERELAPEKTRLLLESGILIPAKPATPYKRGTKDHVEGCLKPKEGCNCPPKMKPAEKEKISQTKLRGYILDLSKKFPDEIKIKYTEKSDKFPEGQISTDTEWMEEFAHMDDLLAEYLHRAKLQKIVSTELPRMDQIDPDTGERSPAAVVHPMYDVLKRTGRTSSFGGEKYPSFNCQNVDPRVRFCFIPRDGYLLFSDDYNQMELGTLAEKCIQLFGYSVLGNKINAGVDVHSYLGARLAFELHQEFRNFCVECEIIDPQQVYEIFAEMEKGTPEQYEFFKTYRTFAKPVNLGYPGGLGPKTFIAYAKANYGIIVDLETATRLREIWKETFPEMVEYFKWINEQCIDPWNMGWKKDKDTGEEKENKLYIYATPFGMIRAGADYCSAANGAGLQAFAAEGALLGLFNVVRACYDPAMGNELLYDDENGPQCRPMMFIHDELVGEVRDDDRATERLEEVSRIMAEAMMSITPHVKAKAKGCLMRRWYKEAEPVIDPATGKLLPWEPKEKKAG